MITPPHFVIERTKEVVWHIKGGYPVTAMLPSLMSKHFSSEYTCSVVRCEETFYKLRARANEL